ncbi:carbohydrate-binding family 9-like protein [Chitinophaga sp.]|uniref:carbohydrate-binding family 9-like protein n=1 Tax=Chitinophaga sp. TaxID=1869181 RepID=UPI00261E62B3|nr:carbohydrate-binding family 9-like protein [uncultured Chitinophaga sp.]
MQRFQQYFLWMAGALAMAPMLLRGQSFTEQSRVFTETPRHYVCQRTNMPLVIDGHDAEKAWRQAEWTDDFTDIEGAKKPAPLHQTRVKMLWDDENLYVFAELKEPHVWGTLRQADTIIYMDNDFEMFLDPTGTSREYFEIEVNALNTVMDLFMPRAYRAGGKAMLNWDVKGLQTAVHIKGTLNNPRDMDVSWTVEMAIPFRSLTAYHTRSVPRNGDTWRVNFSRVQWQHEIEGNTYRKRPKTPEYNWVWSPQGIVDMHAPERWGYLQFSAEPAGEAVAYKTPEYVEAEKFLWELYYRQHQYRRANGNYTADMAALKLDKHTFDFNMEATGRQFSAVIRQGRRTIIIDHEGKIIRYE